MMYRRYANLDMVIGALDTRFSMGTRHIAKTTSRRSFLGRFGALLVGVGLIPVLPIARTSAQESGGEAKSIDPNSCEYWRHCAIDGYLCGCCGGSSSQCPPGTEPSPVSWVGTCENPDDGFQYIISYHDCCGKSGCGNCFCNNNVGELPPYYPPRSNDINWCVGTESNAYHCSTAVIVGVADE